ncbi:hypothetical protein BJV82DRAFT_45347 [Fennellomyces sp. T-0311]|nr:hypothetical protein BJV82DRAFT_45347 [Fennellomyces sp. T-0311]
MHAWKTLRKWRTTLVEDGTLPAGVTEFGFEVTLPGHLSPTFKSEYLEILYTLSAILLPAAKFSKETSVQKEVRIVKTLVPKDVVYGRVDGYRVPRLLMHGERSNHLSWEFYVPRWVCLESERGIEFKGLLRSPAAVVDCIQVDVVQEEIYRGDAQNTRCMKRHLLICMNPPSTYLHPPLETPISFAFPLQIASTPPSTGPQLRRVHSVPTHLSDHAASPTLKKKVVAPNGQVTTLSRGHLTYSLDSPFLQIRHFIRLVIHIPDSDPICIGLPIPITKRIDVTQEVDDSLPTYETTVRDGEELPDYYAASTAGTDEDNIPSPTRSNSPSEQATLLPPPLSAPPPPVSPAVPEAISNLGMAALTFPTSLPPNRRRHHHSSSQPPSMAVFQRQLQTLNTVTEHRDSNHGRSHSVHLASEKPIDIIVEERTMDDFSTITSNEICRLDCPRAVFVYVLQLVATNKGCIVTIVSNIRLLRI